MNCVLCGLEGGKPMVLASGVDIGPAHGPCSGLVMLAHSWKGNAYEQRLMAFFWAEQSAAMRGEPFEEPFPKSPAEMELERLDIERAIGGDSGVLVVSR